MKDKQYKLKEDATKYFALSMKTLVRSKAHWIADGVSMEALEQVEDKIEIYRATSNINNGSFLIKGASEENSRFTEQERADIEKFLNVFGSWEKMHNLVEDFDHYRAMGGKNNHSFDMWLKEKGYDK